MLQLFSSGETPDIGPFDKQSSKSRNLKLKPQMQPRMHFLETVLQCALTDTEGTAEVALEGLPTSSHQCPSPSIGPAVSQTISVDGEARTTKMVELGP